MEENIYTALPRICTGMWSKEYLLKFPFNEELQKGIDREYVEEMQKRGDVGLTIKHHHGYYYRKHEDYSCAGDITFQQKPAEIYVLTTYRNFIDPLVKEWRKDKEVFVSTEEFNPQMADEAEIIWCEWLHNKAVDVANYKCKAKKFLRIHAYEAFSNLIHYVDFSKFDSVIFIADHIKDYVESKVGVIENAVVIPAGVDTSKYPLVEKEKNNKIAYAGEVSRKKGVDLLMFLAESLPEYEFHIAGKYNEEDVARHVNESRPENLIAYPYAHGTLNEFFKDKTYFLNTSLREGNPITVLEAMSCGLQPLVRNWIGADDIYGGFVYKNIQQFEALLKMDYNPQVYHDIAKRFDLQKTINELNEICFGVAV
jgi:glycosyltransferase involved in cell wall biosynthesis